MGPQKVVDSILKICGGQDEQFAGMNQRACDYFDSQTLECGLLKAREIPDVQEIERCQFIVMYYAKILSQEQWERDGRVTDHEDLRFDYLFDLLHNRSMREFDPEKDQRYDIHYWHGYIKRTVRTAILKKIEKALPVSIDSQDDPAADSETDEKRLEKKTFAQSSFAEKKDLIEDTLNAKVDLSMLLSSLKERMRNPDVSEKERSLCRRRRTLIINLLHLIRKDQPAHEACVELRRQRTQDRAERERLKSEMKYDREALKTLFLQKKP